MLWGACLMMLSACVINHLVESKGVVIPLRSAPSARQTACMPLVTFQDCAALSAVHALACEQQPHLPFARQHLSEHALCCPAECIPILTPTNIVLDLVRATPVHHIDCDTRTHMSQQAEVIRAA